MLMMGRAWSLGALAVFAMVSATAAFEDPHGIGYDGHDWASMLEQAKLAYVAGFLAGAATQQAVAVHEAHPKVSVETALSEIMRTHAGTFPFGVNVYKNTLDDYYFYRDNRPAKVYRALLDANVRIRKGSGSK